MLRNRTGSEFKSNKAGPALWFFYRTTADHSHTFTAAIAVHAPEGVVLSYQSENQPQPGAMKTMEIHVGTARLVFTEGDSLEGYYYSRRGRQEHGKLSWNESHFRTPLC